MNLYQLYYFKTLARLEHYTKAAEELCLTQPSLSHAISCLEDELNVLLFEKRGRNIQLTEYGKQFLPYIESAIEEIETGTKKVKELIEEKDGHISIGFIYTLTAQFIPNLVRGFQNNELNRNIKFSLKEGLTKELCTMSLVKSLKEEKFDLIFISLIPKDPEIEFIPLFDQNLVALLPKDCPLASQPTIDLIDTQPYPLIQYCGKAGLKQEINRLYEQVHVVPNIGCEVEDELSMANFVAANLGIAIVPNNPIVQKLKDIVIRPIQNPAYTRTIYIGVKKNRQLPQSVQRFKDFVINSYK